MIRCSLYEGLENGRLVGETFLPCKVNAHEYLYYGTGKYWVIRVDVIANDFGGYLVVYVTEA